MLYPLRVCTRARARAVYIKRAAPREIVKEQSIMLYAKRKHRCTAFMLGQGSTLSYKFSLEAMCTLM